MYQVPECASQPCFNDGTCVDVVINSTSTFRCECGGGFTGDTCEVDIDDCDPNPCFNGGLCIDGVDSLTCNCSSGFIGNRCMYRITECASQPCLNNGTCVDVAVTQHLIVCVLMVSLE